MIASARDSGTRREMIPSQKLQVASAGQLVEMGRRRRSDCGSDYDKPGELMGDTAVRILGPKEIIRIHARLRARVRARARACVKACVKACVRACVRVRARVRVQRSSSGP